MDVTERAGALARPTPPSARLKRIQRTSLTLLVVSGIVNYMDRSALSIANPLIRQELGLSVAQMGLLLSSFLWAYSFTQLPIGGLVDRYKPRRMLAGGLVLWSIAQGMGGLVTGFWSFVATRVLLGVGEAPQFSTCVRVVRDWYNVRDRGLPTGLFAGSSAMGTAISAPLLTVAMLHFGWRWMFIALGIVGVVLGIVWWLLYRNMDDVPLTPEEHRHLTEGEANEPYQAVTTADWMRVLRTGPTWGLLMGFFGTTYLAWMFNAWLPGYLEMDRHMSIPKTGLFAAIPFACQVFGSLSGGLAAQWLTRRGVEPLTAAKIPVVGGVTGMALFTILTSEVADDHLAVACLSIALFLGGISIACAWTLICVVAPRNYVASLAGMKNFGGYFGGALAPTVTGFIVQYSGSFRPALLTGALVGFSSALIYWLGVRRRITVAEITQGMPTQPQLG
jgi:sugar phosphate permease